MELHGVSRRPARLFKLRGHFAGHEATLLLDSGASSEFIDPDFARRCGLELTPSDRTVKLANGSIVAAAGSTTTTCCLDAAKGAPVPFSATFTATPLEGYDAILGVSWLEAHDPLVGWRDRSITVRAPGGVPRLIKPLECLAASEPERIAIITTKGLRRAYKKGQIKELYAVLVRPESAAPAPKEDPAAEALLHEFADVFPDKLPAGLPPTRGVQHAIELKPGSRPPAVRPLHRQSGKDLEVFEQYTRELIEAGHIRVSNSPYGAMALIVRKKDGTPRVVVDYRGLNELTVKDRYPLPLMDELFDRVHGTKFFSKIDLRTGFHQIRVADADVEKTAFRTRYGSFEYLVLPMGLCNAPGTFMRLMNDTFRDMLDKSVLVFLDDILIFSRTEEEHVAHVREVLARLRREKLYAKRSKCEFFRSEVEFLGHRIGADGLAVSQDKVSAVREWPAPRNVSEVRSFLGLAGFYRRFVKDFAKIALPITELTKETTPFVWGEEQRSAFAALKQVLCTAPVLLVPDPALPFTVNCDACGYALGATLQQDQGRGLQPVAFFSKKLSDTERRYDTREKEFMAVREACLHWRHYLHSGIKFQLFTDHHSLQYYKTMPNLAGRLAHWVSDLAEFDYDIHHVPGAQNVVADALSRRADLNEDADGKEAPAHTLAAARARLSPAQEEEQRRRNRAAAEESHPPAPDRPPPHPATGVITTPSQRCTASTKRGEHCKQRTCMGQYCHNHLRSIKGLSRGPSSIPGGGRGLTATRPLPAGLRIDYTGDTIPLAADSHGGKYVLELRRGVGVDAARKNCGEGRWVNDPRGTGKDANCEFLLHTPPGRSRTACVRTLRPIQKGEELLVRYGADYWRRQPLGRKRAGRKRGRRAKRAAADDDGQDQLQAAQLQVTRPASRLTDAIRTAASADEAYAAQVAAPPPGLHEWAGLLYDGNRLVVPADSALRTRILSECHDSTTSGHFGRDKTLDAAKARFAWNGLAADVERYVATCELCQRNKPSQQATPGLLMPLPLPDHPCQEWTTDAVTALPETKRGHNAIQVFVDRRTKLKHYVAVRKDDGAPELARGFVHAVVRAHGVPTSLVSDRDSRIDSNFFRELSRLLGTELRMSTARHPQSDGQSEREIKTLIIALRAYCNERQDDWDEYLDMLELGANNIKQSSLGASPHELLYGCKPRLPIDVALDALAPRVPAATDRAARMQEALLFSRRHLEAAQERQARNANEHRRDTAYSVGDAVLLSTDCLRLRGSTKLSSPWVGPFRVSAVVNANAYTLELPPQLQALHPTFNISRLKPHRDGHAAFPSRPQRYDRPPAEAEADTNGVSQTYDVERVLAQRKRGRATEVLVAWVGWPPEDNSWEPRSALTRSAAGALADFDRSQRN